MATKNRHLGTFVLNVPSRKKGEVMLESTTTVDDEGIVTVKAICQINGAEKDIVIDASKGRMTDEEIQQSRVRFIHFFKTLSGFPFYFESNFVVNA